jgi:hypothetical protein
MKLQISEPKSEDGEKSGNPDSKKNYLKFLNYIHKKSMSQSVKDLKPYHPPAPSQDTTNVSMRL